MKRRSRARTSRAPFRATRAEWTCKDDCCSQLQWFEGRQNEFRRRSTKYGRVALCGARSRNRLKGMAELGLHTCLKLPNAFTRKAELFADVSQSRLFAIGQEA